jgi:hypothetical protein
MPQTQRVGNNSIKDRINSYTKTANAAMRHIRTLPKEEQAKSNLYLLQNLYKKSLYHFSKYALNYKDISVATHGDLIEALESSSNRVLAVMPRGTLKSSLCSEAYPMWLLLRNPNLRIMLDSELYTNSKRFLRTIRQHLTGENLIELVGNSIGPVWSESEIIIKQRTAKHKEPSILCSGIGATKIGVHTDIIIADDLNSPDNSNTQEGRMKVIEHYQMYTSILEPGGKIIVVGTRYHQYDVIGHILENEIGVDNVNIFK